MARAATKAAWIRTRGSLDQHVDRAPDEPFGPFAPTALDDLHQALHPFHLDPVRDLVGQRRRRGPPARREHERERAVIADLLRRRERLLEVRFGLAGKPDDDVRRQRAVGHVLADQRNPLEVALARICAAHPLEHGARARLQRQVDVLTQRGQLSVGPNDVLAHVLGMRACVADPVDPVDAVDHREQLCEGDATGAREIAAIRVDVLPEQRHLAHPVGGKPFDLLDQLARRTADLATARRGHNAVRADTVAADADLHPPLELPLTLARQAAGEAFELEVPLGGQRVAGQELREPVDLSGTERNVDERKTVEHFLFDRLGPASADAHDAIGPLGLQPLGLAQVSKEPIVRVLADRTGVEEDQVGVGAPRRLAVADRLEHPFHPLRVVGVHLAAEGRDVVSLHRGLKRSGGTADRTFAVDGEERHLCGGHRAYSVARDSRITVTLIWPGYSSSFSISRAISCESTVAASSSIALGATITRISRPACIA